MRVLLIGGSTRLRRISPDVVSWVAGIGRECIDATLEEIDLKEWHLCMDNEPNLPFTGNYLTEATRRWSEKVASADAFVIVTPQYNWGYPAPLKNALDHLYREWAGKPVMVITYGGNGGGKCADQLLQVLEGLHMIPISSSIGLYLPREVIEENSGHIDAATLFASHVHEVQKGFGELYQKIKQ